MRHTSASTGRWTILAAIALSLAIPASTAHAQAKKGKKARAAEAVNIPGRVERDITYASPNGTPLKLDLYFPAEKSDKPMPLAVYIHGGGWRNGSKTTGGWYADVTADLVSRGYAVASIDYRLAPAATWPAFIHDCKAAIRFLRANASRYNIDPDHVGAWGTSAGGHLVALLGTADASANLEGDGGNADQSSRIQAVVDLFGPTDLPKMMGGAKGQERSATFGGAENLKQASPVQYVSKDDPPFLIIQGDSDPTVPPEQAKILYERLTAAGVDAKLIMVKNGRHGLNSADIEPTKPELVKTIGDFFDAHLRSAQTKAQP
jgi:acetyl esterase/lipase